MGDNLIIYKSIILITNKIKLGKHIKWIQKIICFNKNVIKSVIQGL